MKKLIKYNFIVLFLLMSFISLAQEKLDSVSFLKRQDSILVLLKNATTDAVRSEHTIALADLYQTIDRFKTFDYAKDALRLAEASNDQKRIGICLNYLGDLYWFSGDFAKSSDLYYKALKIYEGLNDKAGIANCYRNIGWIYLGQEMYKQTLEYYFKSLKINQELGLTSKLIANYDDLGIVYKYLGNYEEALKYCNLTIQLAKEQKSVKGLATGYGNLAAIYVAMGQLDLAIENFRNSNKYHESINDHFNCSEGYIGLAECYYKLNDFDKAIEYGKIAADICTKFNYRNTAASAYEVLAHAYSMKKDFANAYKYMEMYSVQSDSTYNAKNSQQINEMAAKYESEKKEMMISSLEEKTDQDKKFKIFIIIVALVIAGFTVVLFRGNLQKKKANSALSYAYKEIEIKNKDITDSITYSKRIQEATLPPKELKYKLFPDAFVLFKPKDIVSGDFYWYAEKNGKRLIASCDCTGHGVPGALMSMIGNNILNQIVNERGITSAAEILNHLHIEIRKSLKQEEYTENRDGMDIALVVFDSANELDFAGAQRPLWIIRKDGEDVEEIKGNKFSIGGLQTEEDRKFSGHRINLSKGDSIYLFSDGYVDQFGGSEGKKFMTRNFRQLLMSIHNEPMARQELVIDQTMEKWKGNREQIDDVLVIGIRL